MNGTARAAGRRQVKRIRTLVTKRLAEAEAAQAANDLLAAAKLERAIDTSMQLERLQKLTRG